MMLPLRRTRVLKEVNSKVKSQNSKGKHHVIISCDQHRTKVSDS